MLETGGIYILSVTGIIGAILCLRRAEMILNLFLRGFLGIVIIYGCNLFMEFLGYEIAVGINPISIACSTILGLPGVVLLYAVAFVLFI